MKIKMKKTEENAKPEIRNMQTNKNNKNPETLTAVHTHKCFEK